MNWNINEYVMITQQWKVMTLSDQETKANTRQDVTSDVVYNMQLIYFHMNGKLLQVIFY